MPKLAKMWLEPIAGFDPWHCTGGCKFDVKIANRIIKFIEAHCTHSKGRFYGKKMKLERWQKKFFGHLFGWKKDGKRRFRFCFLMIPRKNGKTKIASILSQILLKYDGELGADIYCVAAAKHQAQLVYDDAKAMTIMDDELGEGIKVWKSTKSMEYTDEAGRMAGMLKVMASDGDLILGTNPHAYIIDEVLAQKKFELMENLESGVGMRDQPLGIYLSTAADDGYSPCNIKVDYANKVKRGEVDDPTYFPVIYDLPPSADWHDEKLWKQVNPNLDVTITMEFLRAEYIRAKSSKAEEIKFKRRYLNMQVSSVDSWLSMEDWSNCRDDILKDDLIGADCYVSLDLSSTTDITAIVLYFPAFNACLCRFYCSRTAYENKIEYGLMFRDDLIITDGNSVDYDKIKLDIIQLKDNYKIKKIGFDPWNAKLLSKELESEGFEMVEIGQSAKILTDPVKNLESQIREGNLRHFNNPVLTWMAGNCFLWSDTNGKAVKVMKKNKDSQGKIDGMIALIMCKALEIEDIVNNTESVYNERGLLVI